MTEDIMERIDMVIGIALGIVTTVVAMLLLRAVAMPLF